MPMVRAGYGSGRGQMVGPPEKVLSEFNDAAVKAIFMND